LKDFRVADTLTRLPCQGISVSSICLSPDGSRITYPVIIRDQRIPYTKDTDKKDVLFPRGRAAFERCPPKCTAGDSTRLQPLSNDADERTNRQAPLSLRVSKYVQEAKSKTSSRANTENRTD